MKTIFFDIGYTLVNEDAVWERRCKEQAATEEAKKLGLTEVDFFHEIRKATIAWLPQFGTLIKKYNFTEVAPYRPELEVLYDEAPQVLKTLSEKYKLGIIANQLDGLKERLEGFGILQYFSYVISSADAQVSKPDVRIFEYALKTAGCSAEDAVMIGDRLDNDIAPAKSIGMKTVWIKQGFGALQTPMSKDSKPDYEITNLSELLKINI